ncbi:MAG: hypothetical protein ACYDAM_03425 [Leptospirales bacterium]
MGRWGFILGLAGVGFFLYSALHPRTLPVSSRNIADQSGESWQSLSGNSSGGWSSRPAWPTLTGRSGKSPFLAQSSDPGSHHDLNTQSTVYIGSGSNGPLPNQGNPLLSLVQTIFQGHPDALPPLLASPSSSNAPTAPGKTVPAGSILRGTVLRESDGPGSSAPVFVSIPPQPVGRLRLKRTIEILGYPENIGNDHRLRIRFVRVLFGNRMEASMSGYAMAGGREGVPIRLSRHYAGNMGSSIGRDSLMLGGEAIGSAGWMGNASIGNALAMQEAGNVLYETQNNLPIQIQQSSYRLERGTPVDVVVLQGFPLPAEVPGK